MKAERATSRGTLLWRINSEVLFNGSKDGYAMDEK